MIVHFTGNLCQIQAFLRSYLSGHRQTKKSAAALEEGQRAEHDQKSNRTYHHVYSIDCFLSIENHTMFLVLFPEKILIQDEDEATAKLVRANLVVVIAQLFPVQARRLYARYALKRGFWGLPQRKVQPETVPPRPSPGRSPSCKSFSIKNTGKPRLNGFLSQVQSAMNAGPGFKRHHSLLAFMNEPCPSHRKATASGCPALLAFFTFLV